MNVQNQGTKTNTPMPPLGDDQLCCPWCTESDCLVAFPPGTARCPTCGGELLNAKQIWSRMIAAQRHALIAAGVKLKETAQPVSRPVISCSKFEATIDGQQIGFSTLCWDWMADDVLQQLTVDGCPLGPCSPGAEPQLVGWPDEEFDVIPVVGPTIHFKVVEP